MCVHAYMHGAYITICAHTHTRTRTHAHAHAHARTHTHTHYAMKKDKAGWERAYDLSRMEHLSVILWQSWSNTIVTQYKPVSLYVSRNLEKVRAIFQSRVSKQRAGFNGGREELGVFGWQGDGPWGQSSVHRLGRGRIWHQIEQGRVCQPSRLRWEVQVLFTLS